MVTSLTRNWQQFSLLPLQNRFSSSLTLVIVGNARSIRKPRNKNTIFLTTAAQAFEKAYVDDNNKNVCWTQYFLNEGWLGSATGIGYNGNINADLVKLKGSAATAYEIHKHHEDDIIAKIKLLVYGTLLGSSTTPFCS